jgi:membrane protein DedA with SNARE-associated domain
VFTPLNTIGAAIWAVGLGGASYLLGEAMKLALARAHHYELHAMLLIAAGGFALWIWSYVRDRRRRRTSVTDSPDDSEQET